MKNLDINITGVGGNCPVQGYGTVNGKPFYFRARGERWSMSIGGSDEILSPEWYYEEPYGEVSFEAGWMPEETAFKMIDKAFGLYAASLNA